MPDLSSTTLNPGIGGDAIVDDAVTLKDGTSAKTPVSKLVVGPAAGAGEVIYRGNPLPVSVVAIGRDESSGRSSGRSGTGRESGRRS
jgi:hypothetical protein